MSSIPAKMLGSYTPLYPHLFSRCHWTTKQTHTTVETEAQSDGIFIMTLRRAKFALGVVSPKEGIYGCWNCSWKTRSRSIGSSPR